MNFFHIMLLISHSDCLLLEINFLLGTKKKTREEIDYLATGDQVLHAPKEAPKVEDQQNKNDHVALINT